MLFRPLSFQGSGAARIAAISVIPGWWEAPHSIARSGTELCPEQRLNLRTGAISQREESLPARPAQRRNTPICGNGSVARYKVIHAASRMIVNRGFR